MPCSRILLVEDEQHKAGGLTRRVEASAHRAADLVIATSVRDAISTITQISIDLVILDMALPTFTKEKNVGETGGAAQASGGVEVLRMMQQIDRLSPVIIVTQYPDIYISGELIRLRKIKSTLQKKYSSNLLGVVLYSYDSEDWAASFDALLEKVT